MKREDRILIIDSLEKYKRTCKTQVGILKRTPGTLESEIKEWADKRDRVHEALIRMIDLHNKYLIEEGYA